MGGQNEPMDAEAWNERYRDSELVWSAGPNQFVEAELSGLTPGRALDLAAGEGRNAIWLARRGWLENVWNITAGFVWFMVAVVPCCLIWEWWRSRKDRQP